MQRPRRAIQLVLAALFAVPASGHAATSPTSVVEARLNAVAAGYMAQKRFMGAVLVVDGDKVLLGRGYGMANLDWDIANAPDVKFRIGSVTKQFTAVAILQLVEKGLVRLDDPVRKYVPELVAGDRVTLHHLLAQTSGIFDFTHDDALMKGDETPHTHAQIEAAFVNKPLAFAPGSSWAYSNSNYFLLGLVIEKVTGQAYADYMQAHVFGPAGMTRTTAGTGDAPNSAVGYTKTSLNAVVPAAVADLSFPFAAGAIRSTPNDMIRWDRALSSDVLLTAASRKRMTTPGRNGYAYGVEVATMDGREVDEHTGGIHGFASDFARLPGDGIVILALSNNDANLNGDVVDAVLKMVISGKKVDGPVETIPVPFDDKSFARYAGVYTIDDAGLKRTPPAIVAELRTITLTADGPHLWFKPVGQEKQELFLGADGVLFVKRDRAQFVPAKDDGPGPVQHLTLKQGDDTLGFVRVSVPVPSAK